MTRLFYRAKNFNSKFISVASLHFYFIGNSSVVYQSDIDKARNESLGSRHEWYKK